MAVLRQRRFLTGMSIDVRMREFFFEQLQTRSRHEGIRLIWPFPLDPSLRSVPTEIGPFQIIGSRLVDGWNFAGLRIQRKRQD
jgi:hypothetical protein